MANLPRTDQFSGCKAVAAGDEVNVTAAGAGDNAEVTGLEIDRLHYDSVLFCIRFAAVLDATETLTIKTVTIQHTDTAGSGYADAGTDYQPAAAGVVVATGDTGGSTEKGVFTVPVNAKGLKRYIRIQYTPDLSRGGTDTAVFLPCAVLGGNDEEAPTQPDGTVDKAGGQQRSGFPS